MLTPVHRLRRRTVSPNASRGVTLIEVLIAVLVLSVGLLGLAGLQWNSLKFNHSSLLRSQATNLAYDMTDRLRAKRQAARSGDFDSDTFAGGDCSGEGFDRVYASPANELLGWRCDVARLLPGGQGRVLRDGNTVTVQVRWRDTRDADDALLVFGVSTEL